MMDREVLREVLSKVSKVRAVADIARDMGVPPGALYDFQSGGSMGKQRRAALCQSPRKKWCQ